MNKLYKLIIGYEQEGHSASVVDQGNGFIEVRAQQRGMPPRSAGVYRKEDLLQALSRYHVVRDSLRIIVKAA